ncbi:hypothetical protein F511_43493 [Dorcoceras hygrometricum]|uniref:Uncharacterized protein n=1 Tax=Dorcoceras hygrometricum TaxID=472368 RepID=A0A2Z7C8F6_9LAMI|nr:hypothetical protein F511_43493 [Dorcoceras hygrometricum]
MPPRRRGRGRVQFEESAGQNEARRSARSRTRVSDEEEVEVAAPPVERMDVNNFEREEVVSNGINFYRGFIYKGSAIEEDRRESETTLVQLQYCGRNTLIIQCTNRGKNEQIDEAIDRH